MLVPPLPEEEAKKVELCITDLRKTLQEKTTLQVDNVTKKKSLSVRHRLSPRQVKDVLAGGLISRLAEEED
jgi:aconitate hydratase